MGEHISEALFERFLRTEVSREEGRWIVRHLISGCSRCSALAFRLSSELGLWPAKASAKQGWEQAYEEVFSRAMAFASEQEQRLALEKLRGWGQWAELEPVNPQLRFVMVDSDPSYHTFGLYDRLLEASRWYIRSEPVEAVDILRLAILVAERLNPSEIGAERLADLRANAWAMLGNARRLASDFEGSRRAFNEAWRILEEEGTNDPLDRAHIMGLESGYMQDMGEFETAEASLEEALEIYRHLHDTHLEGRTLLKMADCIGQIYP